MKRYRLLLDVLMAQGYAFQTYAEFLENPAARCIILRHDVEAKYENALCFARIQHEINIRGTYYFRFLPDHFDSAIIREIAALGHEIGYHYDDLSHCHGDFDKAIKRFEKNLSTLREIAPVRTICMEGAPLSKWDNREMWGGIVQSSKFKVQSSLRSVHPSPLTAHYKDFGIIGEPYFDTDFSKVFYLTDTGRRWDGKGSVRDKTSGLQPHPMAPSRIPAYAGTYWRGGTGGWGVKGVRLRRTADLIAAAGLLPNQVMLTFHPQRWTDKPLPWLQELVLQNLKNIVKRVMLNVEF